jgi:release factor glutamine methyltransferase
VTERELVGGMTADAAFRAVRDAFRAAGLDTPELDARVLLGFVLAIPPASWILHRDRPLTTAEASTLVPLVDRRLAREPVARLVGRREFWGLDLELAAATLVPRADTETLVAAALEQIAPTAVARVVDLGTGTGAILLALLSERPGAVGIGIDIAEAALRAAKTNADTLGLSHRCRFVRADWAAPIAAGSVDVLVSNPPYIETAEIDRLEPEVRDHDPVVALDGGADGLDAYRAILPQAERVLRPGGTLALEIGETQGCCVPALVARHRFALAGEVRRDLGGNDRVVLAVRN